MIQAIFTLSLGMSPAQAEDRPRYVQLAPSTTITSQPSEDALQVDLAPAGDGKSHKTLKLIELGDEWVHLETTDDHLAAGFLSHALWNYALSVYVRRSELSPVLVQAYTQPGPDGLEKLLMPGVPLYVDDDGNLRVNEEPAREMGPIPRSYTGETFQHSELADWIETETITICNKDNGVLPGWKGCADEWSPGNWVRDTTQAYRLRTDTKSSIALFSSTEWFYEERRVKALSDHTDEGHPFASSLLMTTGPSHIDLSTVQVPQGTPIFWLDGTPAGTVRRAHELYDLQLEERQESLRCTGLPWEVPREHITYQSDSSLVFSPGAIGSAKIDSTQDSPDEAPEAGPPLEDYRYQLCFRENDLQ
jgi:hypothetical protein